MPGPHHRPMESNLWSLGIFFIFLKKLPGWFWYIVKAKNCVVREALSSWILSFRGWFLCLLCKTCTIWSPFDFHQGENWMEPIAWVPEPEGRGRSSWTLRGEKRALKSEERKGVESQMSVKRYLAWSKGENCFVLSSGLCMLDYLMRKCISDNGSTFSCFQLKRA